MNSTENRLEQEYRKNLERCDRIIEKAEKEHDLDTMVSALNEFQVWRELFMSSRKSSSLLFFSKTG